MVEKKFENLDESTVTEHIENEVFESGRGHVKNITHTGYGIKIEVGNNRNGQVPFFHHKDELNHFEILSIKPSPAIQSLYLKAKIEELPEKFFESSKVEEVRKILEEHYDGFGNDVEIRECRLPTYESDVVVDFDESIYRFSYEPAEKLRENGYIFAGNDQNKTYLKYEGE